MTTAPGFYKTEYGTKAEVVDVRHGLAIGWINDHPHSWNLKGESTIMLVFNLVEPWMDKPEWDWSKTLPWLNWLAMDSDGQWWLFPKKPTWRIDAWLANDDKNMIPIAEEFSPKWKGKPECSLVCRPGMEVTP